MVAKFPWGFVFAKGFAAWVKTTTRPPWNEATETKMVKNHARMDKAVLLFGLLHSYGYVEEKRKTEDTKYP